MGHFRGAGPGGGLKRGPRETREGVHKQVQDDVREERRREKKKKTESNNTRQRRRRNRKTKRRRKHKRRKTKKRSDLGHKESNNMHGILR